MKMAERVNSQPIEFPHSRSLFGNMPMPEFEEQLLKIYDITTTVIIATLLLITGPVAIVTYSRILSSNQFKGSKSMRMIVLNGTVELLTCIFFTISTQLSSFDFAIPFFESLQSHGIAWIFRSFWAVCDILSIHSRFYIAITRLSALRPHIFRIMNTPLTFLACALTATVGLLPSILDIVILNTFTYSVEHLGQTTVLAPRTIRTFPILKHIVNGHSIVMSGLTLFANLLLCAVLLRKNRVIAEVTDSNRSKQERGLMITSIVSYLFYTIYFINGYIAREFNSGWSGYSQYLFLGLSCHSPFWCLLIFSNNIRAVILRRNTVVVSRTTDNSFSTQPV